MEYQGVYKFPRRKNRDVHISEKGSGEIGWYKRIFGWYLEKQNSRKYRGRHYSQTVRSDCTLRPYITIVMSSYIR
jgi:hypothetical protein